MQKIIDEAPIPCKGFYIDKDSIVYGLNPYTGYSYISYREIRNRVIKRNIRLPDKT